MGPASRENRPPPKRPSGRVTEAGVTLDGVPATERGAPARSRLDSPDVTGFLFNDFEHKTLRGGARDGTKKEAMPRRVNRIDRLVGNVLWALEVALPDSELVPMLEQLLQLAPCGSDGAKLAKYHLARLVVAAHPWRAARLARELLNEAEPGWGSPDELWAILGIAHTVMGNYRLARRAHLRALDLAPNGTGHLHNLGHLLDVAFDRPREALRYLRAAHESVPEEPEVASSYAHALVRSGLTELARKVLRRGQHPDLDVNHLVSRWAGAVDASDRATGNDLAANETLEVVGG